MKTAGSVPRSADKGMVCLCLVLLAAAVIATWPVLEMGTNDDSSYGEIARNFAATGHISYNGWTAVILIPQLVWAAGFIKLFGFSFLILRLSTVAMTMLLVPVIYWLSRESGLKPPFAAFATVLTLLSPLTLPEITSYMSDIPAFFWFALCLYAAVRAWKTEGTRPFVWWSILLTVAGFLSGLDRQIYWIAPLVFLPVLAWVRRRGSGIAWLGAMWIVLVVAIVGSLRWYTAQPYILSENLGEALQVLDLNRFLRSEILLVFQLGFIFGSMLVPVLAGLVAPGLRTAPRKWSVPAIGAVVLVGLGALVIPQLQAPFMGNVVTRFGVVPYAVIAFGEPLLVIGATVGVLITVGTALCSAGGVLALWTSRKTTLADLRRPQTPLPLIVLAASFTAVWVPAVFLRVAVSPAVDRYMIPFILLGAIPLLWIYQEQISGVVSSASWIVLAIYTIYAVAVTHDAFAEARARWQGAEILRRAGVARNQISAGFEYDILTQIETEGYVNHYLIDNPPSAYREPSCTERTPWYFPFMPSLNPRFVVTLFPVSDFAAPRRTIPYTTWMPPAHHEAVIQQIPDGLVIACH